MAVRRGVSVLGGLLLVAISLTGAGVAGASTTASDPDVVSGSWVVELEPGHDAHSESARLARQYGGRVGHVYTAALSGFSFQGSDRAAANLARNAKVSRVEPDRVVHAVGTVPTGVQRIDSRDSTGTHEVSSSTGTGIHVAVLDTGVDAGHEQFGSRVKAGTSCVDSEPSSTNDGNGHGTHVSGTIAGADVGVAPGATIVAVKVLDSGGSGTSTGVICGVDYVTANATTISVANMSLGGSSSESGGCNSSTLHTAICNSVGAGVTYSVAAGNDSRDADGFVPAKYPEVLTVSAFSDLDGERDPDAGSECVGFGRWKDCDETFARFSNHGSIVDVMAPGVRIYSSVPGGYDTYSGTSMAAPHVAGVAALVLEDNALSVANLDARLKATGECPDATWASSSGSCSGSWSGDGDTVPEPMVNAARAVANTTGEGTTDPVETGTISGTVTDSDGGASISGATVTVDGTTHVATTGEDGSYSISDVPTGTYSVTASASDYDSLTKSGVAVEAGTTTTVNFALAASSSTSSGYATSTSYSASGGPNGDKHMDITVHVEDANGPVDGATVVADITYPSGVWAGATATTNSSGDAVYSFRNTGPGCYSTDVLTVNGEAPASESDAGSGC